MIVKLISISIIIGTFLVGCGGEVKGQDKQDEFTPHQIDLKSKTSREFVPDSEEYQNFMKTYYLNSRLYSIKRYSDEGWITKLRDLDSYDKNSNYAFYYDSDGNTSTGYYSKWVPDIGADFLVENGVLFKYTGTPGSNEWNWKILDYDVGDIADEEGVLAKTEEYPYRVKSYGIKLNSNWEYTDFLGYVYSNNRSEKNLTLNEESDITFTILNNSEDAYIHAYKKDNKKMNSDAVFYNYTFDNGYYTEALTLFNDKDKIVTDKLQYAVRDYSTVTIIPKKYLNETIVKSIEIRDKGWSEINSFTTRYRTVEEALRYGYNKTIISENERYVALVKRFGGPLSDGVILWDRRLETFVQILKYSPLSASHARREGAYVTKIRDNQVVEWYRKPASRCSSHRCYGIDGGFYEYDILTGVNTQVGVIKYENQ